MKLKYMFSIVLAFLFLSNISIFAQAKEMTFEQWQAEMNGLKARKETLQKEVNVLKTDVDNLKKQLAALPSFDDCKDELYAAVGSKKSGVDDFRKAVTELEGKIRRKEGPKADRQADLSALQLNKISALPEFFEKVHVTLPALLAEWIEAPRDITYTVVRGDHLWGIARKKEHYGNPFAWPKIYQANRDKIKNPDLIFPKQEFRVPNLTQDEKDRYDRLRRNFKPAPVQ
ncbi:MAG: peptidoglycan-binding protein LysM [Chlorobiaceae bacterium]|nr:peptidoglycan-binding protein LysM [Chlorobiaceae bacterium]MBA4308839.1 peptidoglycan-binding protein LysM [Chlorobiaceae bacterium]